MTYSRWYTRAMPSACLLVCVADRTELCETPISGPLGILTGTTTYLCAHLVTYWCSHCTTSIYLLLVYLFTINQSVSLFISVALMT